MAPANDSGTKAVILDAARRCLLADGFHAISTRKIAAAAGVPLSQVHYHFGSKGGMMLALLEAEDRRRLRRQTSMYAEDAPLWQRYEQACDFLDEDIESGYVRVLQEMIAAGWSTPEIADKVRSMQQGWYDLLADVATEAAERFGGLGPFTPIEVATLIGCSFIGAESLLLLGFQRQQLPIRAALRRVGQLIRAAEESLAVSAGERRRGEG
jgi:AcrR family transcriptional regulator